MALTGKLRTIYLYLFSVLGLVLVIIGTVTFINLGLKTYIFKKADTYPIYRSAPIEKPDGSRKETEEEAAKRIEEEKRIQEEQRTANRHRDAARALAFILVGLPVYIYHWRVIQKEKTL